MKNKRISRSNWSWGFSKSGWNNTELFNNYLETVFKEYIGRIEDKKILLLDAAPCHMDPSTINILDRLNVFPLTIPCSMTDKLQPLDILSIKRFKHNYKQIIYEKVLENNFNLKVTNDEFLLLVKKAWAQVSNELIKKSFSIFL